METKDTHPTFTKKKKKKPHPKEETYGYRCLYVLYMMSMIVESKHLDIQTWILFKMSMIIESKHLDYTYMHINLNSEIRGNKRQSYHNKRHNGHSCIYVLYMMTMRVES